MAKKELFPRTTYKKYLSGENDDRIIYIAKKIVRTAIFVVIGMMIVAAIAGLIKESKSQAPNNRESTKNTLTITTTPSPEPERKTYKVTKVVDGDTIDIDMDGKTQRIRLIGVNTPETVHPEKAVECFGEEASKYAKSRLTDKEVSIETDDSQDKYDKYNRMLAYVFLDDENFNESLIKNGYAYEYTYNVPYKYQSEFKAAQKYAEQNNIGLWAPDACKVEKEEEKKDEKECNIKGNISSKGEKIYHMPGQKYYNSTKIDTSKGERMFCSEKEAQSAGWRKSKV